MYTVDISTMTLIDLLGVTQARQQLKGSRFGAVHKAQFLSVSASHSRVWLLALAIASCGFKLDEVVPVAVTLRLGLNLGPSHLLLQSDG